MDFEVLKSMQEKQFFEILNADEVIKDLQSLKFDEKSEILELFQVFSKKFKMFDLQFNCLTAGFVAFLFSIKNKFFYLDDGQPQNLDIDCFLYLLHCGFGSIEDNFFENANGFCKRHNIDYEQAKINILRIISNTFRPMRYFVSDENKENDKKSRFNLHWLTMIVYSVSKTINATRDEIIYKIPLNECLYYCLHLAKENDVKKRVKNELTNLEIDGLIYKRTMELGKIYHDSKNKKVNDR